MTNFLKYDKKTSHEIVKGVSNKFFEVPDQIKTKRCPCCLEIKPFTEYYNDISQRDGKRSYCKVCYNAYENLPHRKVRSRLSQRVWSALKSQNAKKRSTTMDLVGCTPNELAKHLESKFTDKMFWGNYGSYWHIDHERPCASFNLQDVEEQKKCFHWSNLQPLEKIENLSKNSRVTIEQIRRVNSNLDGGLKPSLQNNRGSTKQIVRGIPSASSSITDFFEG